MQICFFEDDLSTNLYPLILTRPVDDLRTGILTIREKWLMTLGTHAFSRTLRPELNKIVPNGKLADSEPTLWINARYLPDSELLAHIEDLSPDSGLQSQNIPVAALTDGKRSMEWLKKGGPDFSSLMIMDGADYRSIRYMWDLFIMNGEEISVDIKRLGLDPVDTDTTIAPAVSLANEEDIYIDRSAAIEAGCVLDATHGPIFVGANARIMAGSLLRGPVAVCEDAIVKMGARIYEDTTIGPVCKAGGEVANTVFHSYSNKAHDGYIGNSVVGQWCNFGAGTTVSNLKTNYSTVRVTDWQTDQQIDTGEQFVGILMGDHSKTAINCVINSGTVCGVNCNILSRDFPPKKIGSFSWVGSNVIQPYDMEKALVSMKLMMQRRNVEISKPYKKMMQQIFSSRNGGV
jgi:UDP-N-acetylglucosamine diphosphorylase/glucosamine-1-phosphate N-acetyltransferase